MTNISGCIVVRSRKKGRSRRLSSELPPGQRHEQRLQTWLQQMDVLHGASRRLRCLEQRRQELPAPTAVNPQQSVVRLDATHSVDGFSDLRRRNGVTVQNQLYQRSTRRSRLESAR